MCGAFSQFTDFRILGERFAATPPKEEVPKRYNIRPSQPIPVIFNTEPDKIDHAMWGITRFFGDKKMFFINARNDSMEKPTWRKLLNENRCMILADGFYEWQKQEKSTLKIPYRFELKSKKPFAFAGLWKMEKDEHGKEIPHCVIITTEPNELVEVVHNRMPVMLNPETEKEWLNPDNDTDELLKMLIPYPAKEMLSFPISTLINKPSNDVEDVIKPAQNSA